MNKRSKGKSKKTKNPQPQPSPKVADPTGEALVPKSSPNVVAPADVTILLPSNTADESTDIKLEDTRVPKIKEEVVTSSPIETLQEDKAPEKPKRNRSKRNKNKSENKPEIRDDEVVVPSVETKLRKKEVESNKSLEYKIDNVTKDSIPEKEIPESVETPTTTSRKKNKNKNKNKNVDSQQATLPNQQPEAEKGKKAKLDATVQKQKEEELAKLNSEINVDRHQKQDNSENAPSAASRKKKGKKNKSQSDASDNIDKLIKDAPNTSNKKTNSPNRQNQPATNVTNNSKVKSEHTESNVQSDLKLLLNTSLLPNAHKLDNLVTPDLVPITNLDFEIDESSDKHLSKSARKKAKKSQNKNQETNPVATNLNKDKVATPGSIIENSNVKQDINKLSLEIINNEISNEPIHSCPVGQSKDIKKEQKKEKDCLDEIKQSLDRSFEELIIIEKEQIDKMGTDTDSTPYDNKPNINNNLINSDDNKKEPGEEGGEKIPVTNNSQKSVIPTASLKEIPELECENSLPQIKTLISEPSTNKDEKIDKVDTTKIEPLEASIIKEVSEVEKKVEAKTCEKLEHEPINSDPQKTIAESNSSEESTGKETGTIHDSPLQDNFDLGKRGEPINLIITDKQDQTQPMISNKKSDSYLITETKNVVSEQIPQKGYINTSKNKKQTQVLHTKDSSVPILKEEIKKANEAASTQKQEEITIDSAIDNEQIQNIVGKPKELKNKSLRVKGNNNMTIDVAKPTTTQPLTEVTEIQEPERSIIDSKERTSECIVFESKPVPNLTEKLDETYKAELSDDLELIPELIPLSVLDVQNENQILTSILNSQESVKEAPKEILVPEELPHVQQLATKQDKGKGQSKKGGKTLHLPSTKPTEDLKQSTAEIVEKDILNLVQKIDSVNSEAPTNKQDDIDAEFEIIAQGAIKKEVPKDNPSLNVKLNEQKKPVDKMKTNKPSQEEKIKGNRSKNFVGPSDIPVISNKDDYKKEKNKKGKNKSKDVDTSAPSFNGDQKQKDGFRSEGDDEEFIYKYSFRKVFMANACHICKANLKSHRIVCSYCNLVSYCGQKHKDEDWPQHQALCFAISTIVHLKGLKFVYSDAKSIGGQDYRLLRMQTIVSCEKILKRKLSPCEQEILLYPRMCLEMACREWRSAALKDCDVCGQVSYCKDNPSHFLEEHKKWCDSYSLYYKLVAHQQNKGRIEPQLPTKVISDATFQLPANTRDFVKELYEGKLDLDDIHYAALTQIATAPLTALYGYQLYHKKNPELPKDDTSFTIHVVGAELQFEADMLNKWEVFFLHLHPTTVDLKVVFIGPELNPSKLPLDILSKIRLCKECRQANRNLTFEFQDGLLYHNYAKSEKFSKPNLVCAFNPGLHRTTGYGGLDTWPDTIKVILGLGGPVCVTSYTSYELPRDLARLHDCWPQVHIQTEPQLNPYASVRPDRNFISDDEMPLIFKNYYFMVVTG